ncbi:thiopeptide-type bacteriocin biosynthesis domain-containing protein [Sinosporangium album]|uniref:Thiopeptide-type bacteriocin biosynthesis domain-containing protein n=1 Tax=Sinosporangium album TaxID=504805 RepID=A0A1G7YTW6_9ACTN|nr:lantibiotic dehydratase [Sinosporangium album]SDG99817.1 thiopeptide-type bacteriocin biosynthesis domain-containing protein [Sinosporangium album]
MTNSMFVPFPVVLARVPLLALIRPGGTGDTPEPVDPLVREGMFLASRQAGALVCGTADGRPVSRAAATVRGYTLRARSRPTPHGVFAGVTTAGLSDRDGTPVLTMGGAHRARTVPDPGWLAAVADRLLRDPAVLASLTLSANNLTVQRGDRLEHERPAEPGTAGVRRVTVRATDATTLIMKVCERGASWSQALTAVTTRWPTAAEPSVRAMAVELVRLGFLLPGLLPERGDDDPLGHLLRGIPVGNPLREDLTLLRRHLADADAHPPGAPQRLDLLIAAREAADRILVHERPLRVDVAIDADLIVPAGLARQAADAAAVLWRIGSGPDPLAGFHDRFATRYGRHRLVPVLDALDPVLGIAPCPADTAPAMPRDQVTLLASMIASATAGNRREVELDAATVERLVAAHGNEAATPPRTGEIYARVVAGSAEDAAAGRLHLAVYPGGGTQEAGSSSGRFAGLLPTLREVDYQEPDALVAELAVRSRTPSGMTLAPETGFAPHRIPLGVPVRPGDLKVDDLLLSSDGRRLTLWSVRLDQAIIPVLYSRLSPHLLPPIAQFLRLLGQHGARPWQTWSWGPLSGTPFQPRVRYGPTILSPARWVLPPTVIDTAHRAVGWDAALDVWQATAMPAPPQVVVVTDHDRALPIDLRRADDRAMLRRHVRRGITAVTEEPGGSGAVQGVVAGPQGPHALELVVSFARKSSPPVPTRPSAIPQAAARGSHLPGSRWLSLVIRTPATCQDEVLARLAAADGLDIPWFWLRYADHHGPHLRVRFYGDPAHLGGRILPAVAALTTDLIQQRLASSLSVEPYEQEIERYGGTPRTMDAAEQVFTTDSRLVLAALTAEQDPDQRIVVAALSAVTIIRTLTDGDRAALTGHHLDRRTRRRLTDLRTRTRAAARTTPAGTAAVPTTHPAWIAREEALTTYRNVLNPARRIDCASSLTHMHINRLLGGTALEPLTRALAVDLLFAPDPALGHQPAT